MRDAFRILHQSIEFGKWRSHVRLAMSCSEDPDGKSERLYCVLTCVYVLTWYNASIWLVEHEAQQVSGEERLNACSAAVLVACARSAVSESWGVEPVPAKEKGTPR
jgi:hypothetical protein